MRALAAELAHRLGCIAEPQEEPGGRANRPSTAERTSCATASSKTCLRRRCGRRYKAELLQHGELVKHQIKRDMLAIAKAEHLDIVDFDPAARRWNVSHWTAQNAVLGSGECALLDCDVIDDVNGLDFNMRVREGSEPAAEKCGAGGLSIAVHPARRRENDIVSEDFGKARDVVGVEGLMAMTAREAFEKGTAIASP